MGIFDLFKPNVEKLMEKRNVNGLLKALQHKNSHVRAHEAVEPLIDALLTDNVDVRREAAGALGIIKDARAIDALIENFKYGLFFNPDLQTITDAYGNEEIPNYSIGDSFASVHGNAKWALTEIGEPAVDSLLNTLKDESSFARAAAAHTLGTIKDKRAIEPLRNLLNDPSSFVIEAATWSLGELENKGHYTY